MPTPTELADAYLAGAEQLRAACAGMTREQLLARPVAGKWSTLEVVCHLADFEPIMADRMRRVVALDKPLLLAADENAFAKNLAYHDRDAGEELAVIEAVRRSTARLLRHLPAEALQRTGIHSERGTLTLEQIIGLATRHVPNHLVFIEEKKKALGIG